MKTPKEKLDAIIKCWSLPGYASVMLPGSPLMTCDEFSSAFVENYAKLLAYKNELLKLAALVGEEADPFAAWETIQPIIEKHMRDSKRWASGLSDDELLAEQAKVKAVIAKGFGEHEGSPSEWYYEREEEVDREIIKRMTVESVEKKP